MLPVQKVPVYKGAHKPAARTIERELVRPSPYRAAKAAEYRKKKKHSKKRQRPLRGLKFFKEILEDAADFVEDIFD
jgi:hypothetical protein